MNRLPHLLSGCLVLLLWGCGSAPLEKPEEQAAQTKQAPTSGPALFDDYTQESGLAFRHNDGRNGKRYYVEIAGSGGGFFDYDNDGDLDIYLLNGARPPEGSGEPFRNALFENRDNHFFDVTQTSGTGDTGFGQGMCVADYDGDGYLDLFLTNFGRNVLYRNRGDSTFEDVTLKAGLHHEAYSTGCAFADVDLDGDLDLYVSNYVDWSYENNKQCGFGTRGTKSYCRPDVFKGQTDQLYINQGDGTFTEEGKARGLSQALDDRGFSVIFSDMDNDGDPDIMVANDGTANRYYQNDGKGFFRDVSEVSGLAFNRDGESEAGMGMDVADINGDGFMDQFVTNYSFETNTLYLNQAGRYFEDHTSRWGLSNISYNPVSWGCRFFDYDNDGILDLAVANGHLMDNINQVNNSLTYEQPNHLFKGDGKGFVNQSAVAGVGFSREQVTRGLAVADFNDDGRLDLLFTNGNAAPNLLVNQTKEPHNWVGFQLVGTGLNRFAIGARVQLYRGDNYLGTAEVRSGGSFYSQSDLRLHFGLGTNAGPVTAKITWPDGTKTEREFNELNRYHQVLRK